MLEIDNPFGPWVVISQLISLGIEIVAGVKLVRLGRRGGKLPESLMGAAFLFRVLGFVLVLYALMAIRSVHVQNHTLWVPEQFDAQQLDLGWTPLLAGLGWTFLALASAAHLFFTALVFHPTARAVHRAVGLLVLAGAAGVLAHGAGGGFARGFGGVAFWLMNLPGVVGVVWLAVEAFRFHGRMRRRLILGLAEPVVANRFLLFGWGSTFRLLGLLLGFSPAFYKGLALATVDRLASIGLLLMAIAFLSEAVCWWLAFFPSRRFVAFLDRRESLRRAGV
jgi:hypothetical protein